MLKGVSLKLCKTSSTVLLQVELYACRLSRLILKSPQGLWTSTCASVTAIVWKDNTSWLDVSPEVGLCLSLSMWACCSSSDLCLERLRQEQECGSLSPGCVTAFVPCPLVCFMCQIWLPHGFHRSTLSATLLQKEGTSSGVTWMSPLLQRVVSPVPCATYRLQGLKASKEAHQPQLGWYFTVCKAEIELYRHFCF